MAAELPVTPRTQVRRHRDRADYDRATVDAILAEGTICHVAVHDGDTTWMVPTAYGVLGDELVLHGALANNALAAAARGVPVTVAVTLTDAFVLARSTFNHSINYRSVVIFGVARAVTDPEEKTAALAAVVDHLLPGRSGEARPPDPSELRQTAVVALPVTEASAKVRTGPPMDGDGPDGGLPVWAGELPLRTVAGAPLPAPDLTPDAPPPSAGWLHQPRWAPGG
ncbi:MAG TPA: pyridoxamine 5'-phosphate oxidase family protein [Acidimicrobiales bacterium]|nr:pyridoxamine 5'-phosphate oxidase family protein [Acidimicrobiales bacterium]